MGTDAGKLRTVLLCLSRSHRNSSLQRRCPNVVKELVIVFQQEAYEVLLSVAPVALEQAIR